MFLRANGNPRLKIVKVLEHLSVMPKYCMSELLVLRGPLAENLESILPNFDFFISLIFAIKLSHFKVQTIFSHAPNTQA